MLSADPAFRARIARGAEFLDRLLREDGVVYGVTTGYGDSCTVAMPPELVPELPHHLYAYHGCGLGRIPRRRSETRAVLATRLASLSQRHVRRQPGAARSSWQRCSTHDILPLIPAEGSVGASGDLTPLSYVAAVLCGEREVHAPRRAPLRRRGAGRAGIAPLRAAPEGRPGDHERHRGDDRAGLPGLRARRLPGPRWPRA